MVHFLIATCTVKYCLVSSRNRLKCNIIRLNRYIIRLNRKRNFNVEKFGLISVILISILLLTSQGDIGPFSAGLPIDVPLWMAVNLKQRQKARIRSPEWMDVGKYIFFKSRVSNIVRKIQHLFKTLTYTRGI